MAIGIDADADYAERTGIPSGGGGTLSGGGFTNFFVGTWLYRPSAGNSHAGTSGGYIIGLQAGAREMKLGFDNTFGSGTASDPLLQVIFNSGGGTGSSQTFSGANFLDEWVYYFLCDNATDGQIAGYIRLSNLSSATTIVRTNDNAGSQFINTLTFGNSAAHTDYVFGHYALARARDSATTTANAISYAGSATTTAGDWGFWPLANNADTGDDSGNARDLTFAGTLTDQSDPVLSAGGGAARAMLHYRLRRAS